MTVVFDRPPTESRARSPAKFQSTHTPTPSVRAAVEPFAYFKDVLARLYSHRVYRLAKLLPFNWMTKLSAVEPCNGPPPPAPPSRQANPPPARTNAPARKSSTGACQDSCRLVHAANGCLSMCSECALMTESRSGLSVTAPTGDQFRVSPAAILAPTTVA